MAYCKRCSTMEAAAFACLARLYYLYIVSQNSLAPWPCVADRLSSDYTDYCTVHFCVGRFTHG